MEGRNLLLVQAIQETAEWKKILGLLQQENIQQKHELAEMLKDNTGNKGYLLEIAEYYQNQFIQQDEALRFMWADLAHLERQINQYSVNNDDDTIRIDHELKKIRKEMECLQGHFDQVKSQFRTFLEPCGT